MTVTRLEQHMAVRAERPYPPSWQKPGAGRLDRSIWLTPSEAAPLLFSSPQALRKRLHRLPHVVSLAKYRFLNKNMIEAIRGELEQGHDFDQALVNLGIEQPSEEQEAL